MNIGSILQQPVGELIQPSGHRMQITHLALLTSGGDAPGMNAAIRAVVRSAHFHGAQVTGVMDGYNGLVKRNFITLGPRDVRNIIQRGGTMLRSARSEAFRTQEGRATAANNLRVAGIDALIVIGGGGSQSGAYTLATEQGVRVMGIASTIDNDLGGSDRTIGFDTACNTALEAIDRLRDTASSYGRTFFVEVMGRDTGFIAMHTGIAAGAEYVMVPEQKENVEDLVRSLENRSRDKSSSIVIVAEGDEAGGAFKLAEQVKQRCPQFDIRVSVLGHLQRGGSPSMADRLLASRLGVAAVEGVVAGEHNCVVGIVNGAVTFTPFANAIIERKSFEADLQRLVRMLAV
jgi:6-phosphofructokinase 1